MATPTQELESGLEAEKAREQAYFDAAQAELNKALAYRNGPSSGGTAYERRALAAAASRRQRIDEQEPVAFGRIDMLDGETRYIGKVSVRDDATSEVLVWQWQSPAADPYNNATIEDQAGVARRRVFDAPANVIRSFEDELFEQIAEELGQLDEFRMVGDPLLEDLQRTRGHYMQDIVRTIQAEQNRLIREDKDQLLVIQGGPGTGKTAIALHRISWLLYTYRDTLEPKDVLFVGPNQTFAKYVRRVLPDLGDEDVVQQSLLQLMAGPDFRAKGAESPPVARLKGTALMAELLRKALYQRVKVPTEGLRIRRENGLGTVGIAAEAIKSALGDLRSSPYSTRRALLKGALRRIALSSIAMPGSIAAGIDDKSLESEVERVWPQISPQQFVVDLYGSKARLRAAGATEAHVEALYRPAPASIRDVEWTPADLAVLDYAIHAITGVEHTYGHIVVDEAQDLSIMQLLAMRRRSRDGSMTIVGDMAQATSLYAQKDWDQALRYLESDMPANVDVLSTGYRVPQKVMAVAERVLALAAPDIEAPQAIRDVIDEPRWIVSSQSDITGEVVGAVRDHSSRGLFVGVIASAAQWGTLTVAFTRAGIRWSESTSGGLSQGINLVTPEDSKGLEFDAVVVVDPARILEGPQGAKLLYIALTRTVHYLDIVLPAGRIPKVLEELVPLTPAVDEMEPEVPEFDDAEVTWEEAETTDVQAVAVPELREVIEASIVIAKDEPEVSRPDTRPLDNMWENFAHEVARRFVGELRDNAGPAVQRRVVDLMAEMLG